MSGRIEIMDCFVDGVWMDETPGSETVRADLRCPVCDEKIENVDCNKAKYLKCNQCHQALAVHV